jgi:hypothetical protein
MDCRKIAALGKTTEPAATTPKGTSGAAERRSATTKHARSSTPATPKTRMEALPPSETLVTA